MATATRKWLENDFRKPKKTPLPILNEFNFFRRPWENISSEVSNFTRTNEVRPDFLVQLFRELQHVNTDNLRQRTLESIQETVSANNLSERTTNTNGVNVNLIENRNNIRGNRSNLNRNQSEGPGGIDQLFCQLREIQNTIRQDVATRAFALGENNLENPNISNVRDLAHSRNNLENEGLRDLRMYFEANLCNFGGNHSTLENPNLSNIRENLTRRGPGTSDYENVNPKNVDLSIYDNAAVELRRSNLDSSAMSDGESQFRNFEVSNAYTGSNYLVGNQFLRTSNNLYELGSFEEAVGGQGHFLQESGSSNSRFQVLEGGDNFSNSRPFLPNGNDSGIDINFNNEERKRSLGEGEAAAGNSSAKPEKNGKLSTFSH